MKKRNLIKSTLYTTIITLLLSLSIMVSAKVYAYTPADFYYSTPSPVGEYDYSILGIPDTQNLAKWVPGTLSNMFMKLTSRAKQNKVVYALHVGDHVQDATDPQFTAAREALAQFDDAGIKYSFVPGNHDFDRYTGDIPTDKTATMYNKYFKYSYYSGLEHFGGAFQEGTMINTYQLFEVVGVKYLVMSLDDAPTQPALAWASEIISEFSDRRTIILTHDYFLRPTGNTVPKSVPGEEIWEMAKQHNNVFMILHGHRSSLDPIFVMGIGDHGNKIMQITLCFQNTFDEANNNVPLAMYMRFNEANKTIHYSVINPVNDKLFNGNEMIASFEDANNPTVGLKSKTYQVTWRNFDGSILKQDAEVAVDRVPSYSGTTPVKPSDDLYNYVFKGWSPEVTAVTGNATYVAEFEAVPKDLVTYSVYWMNYDGTLLETDTNVVAGTIPTFDGTEPVRPADSKNSYTFAGWNPTVGQVTGDEIYTAQFIPTPLNPESTPAGCGNANVAVISIIGLLSAAMIPLFIRRKSA